MNVGMFEIVPEAPYTLLIWGILFFCLAVLIGFFCLFVCFGGFGFLIFQITDLILSFIHSTVDFL